MAGPTKEIASIGPIPVAASSVPASLSPLAQRVTSVLLNGKNFHAWSRSFQLYLGGKRKTRWILGKEPKPTASDPKFDEWMYAHARNESRIFELYRDISHASQPALGLSVADYFGYPQNRWEELTQYEPLSDFPSDGVVESKRLDRRHTYQFLMGLKPEFEALRTQILNTSPLPSLYEAFATVDGDERRRKLLPSISLPETTSTVLDQTAFVVPIGTRPYCQHCHKPGHLIDRCFILHPELKPQFNQNRGGGRVGGQGGGRGRVGAIAEMEPMQVEFPNLNQLQTQIAQLQSHLGLVPSSSSSGPMANIAAESPTALYELVMKADSAPPRPLPILESPPPSLSGSHALAPLPSSSSDSGDLDLELNRESEKAMEAIECDVGNVLDVRGPSDFHVMEGGDGFVSALIDSARDH
ncbi:Rho GTPase activating protein with PAK-box/P21-Rho-binding domain-containing protein [Actinidia rufa]|uniref:Rho GTPase activating protein with PAK-box/P21-Rho-binding domain-containing protein n=1 Tax=Actinidia rufa TaxID=165716 RepID=A0A7J0GS90_9ERIC|nr:Rho GTPase activating protein with PAK-box/P21-Rho-binding domain-containing protein [Actinidia rufa]